MTRTKQHPYLFFNLNSQKEMLTGNNYTGILQNTSKLIVGKKLSVNLLRHIYITHFLKKESSIQDKTIIAEFMGQGYTPTMLEKYNRVNLNEMAEEVLEGTALKGMVLHFD
jgi:site-specific recombinase XerD